MKMPIARIAAACFACAALQAHAVVEILVQSTMQDAIKVTTRKFSTGTNVQRADIDVRELQAGSVSSLIDKAAHAALDHCKRDLRVKIDAAEMDSRDFVNDTSTRLSGLGLYVSVSKMTDRGSNTGFIAPWVSAKLHVTGPGMKDRDIEVAEFQRIDIARADTLDFITGSKGEVERAVASYAARVIEQRLRKEMNTEC